MAPPLVKNPTHLKCKVFRHAMEQTGPLFVMPDGSVQVKVKCLRCGTVRTMLRRKKGELLATKGYDWPESYPHFSGDNKPKSGDFWGEYFENVRLVKAPKAVLAAKKEQRRKK